MGYQQKGLQIPQALYDFPIGAVYRFPIEQRPEKPTAFLMVVQEEMRLFDGVGNVLL